MAAGDQSGDTEGSRERISALEAALAARNTQLAERDAQLVKLTEQVAKLTEQIAKLTEVVGRNSKNSNLPPSSDGPGSGSRTGTGGSGHRRASGRKRGGQKGHRGSYRELLPIDRVDAVVDLFPDTCLGCKSALPRVVDSAAARYQQLELRDHRPHVTEWRRHEVTCPRCGTSTQVAQPSQR